VEAAADAIPEAIPARDIALRRDFRGTPTFTIDPADAKDFDDALSVRSIGNGLWEIGVHIADVTHYVTEDSVIEKEARERATSVYLVDRTIPMLPEKLSNNLCSLRPDEDKLCFSAVFEMDAEGNITKEWLGRTVIRSTRRFSYEEAQQVIETGQGDYKEEVLSLNAIARKLRAARFSDGAITFDREEAKFTLDATGKPTGVYFKVMKESNQLIEEFMLLANRKVAQFVGDKRGKGTSAERTFIYRVHDKPDPDKLAKFTNFILKFGYYFKPVKGREVSREMNKLMGEIKGKSEENVISTLAIRTMAKAYYSTDNIGHYGLAFPYYSHFTSPIRRYPDMMVHRLLAHYLAGGKSADKAFYDEQCEHSSDMELLAAEAERASIKYKMVEFMLDRIGQEFAGVISGVTERGIYVELAETHIEGMVAVRDMADDFYTFDEENYAMRGQRTGRRLTLGDKVRIKVKGADLPRKQLDFELTATIDFATGTVHPVIGQDLASTSHPTAFHPSDRIKVKRRR
jgi:ribonuclease R